MSGKLMNLFSGKTILAFHVRFVQRTSIHVLYLVRFQVKYLMNHPAGPFTIHFWAPSWKWMLSVSNLMDIQRPVDRVSTTQQAALCATGFIWSRYSMVITPKNWNLFWVNISLAITGTYHLGRKLFHELNKEDSEKKAEDEKKQNEQQ
jgi:hypothetical protein